MKTITTILTSLLFCLSAQAQIVRLVVQTDKAVYAPNEVVYLHINAYDANDVYVSALFHVTVSSRTLADITWMSTYPDRDSYLVYYYKKKSVYDVAVEGNRFTANTSFQVR